MYWLKTIQGLESTTCSGCSGQGDATELATCCIRGAYRFPQRGTETWQFQATGRA